MVGLTFTFTYSVGGGGGVVVSGVQILPRWMDVEVGVASGGVVGQVFESLWVLANSVPYPTSGNPGYLTGLPVLFGTLLTEPVPAIAYFPSLQDTLTLPQDVYKNGMITCGADPLDRVQVEFGNDWVGGCTLYFGYTDLVGAAGCAGVRAKAYQALTGGVVGGSKVDLVGVVGRWGNSSVVDVGQWVNVIEDNLGDSSQPATNPGTCSSVLTSLSLQFLTTKLGSTSNPQHVIIGARVTKTWGAFSYRCILPNDCRSTVVPSTKQKFRVRASVSFVEVDAGTGVGQAFVPPPPRLCQYRKKWAQVASTGMISYPASLLAQFRIALVLAAYFPSIQCLLNVSGMNSNRLLAIHQIKTDINNPNITWKCAPACCKCAHKADHGMSYGSCFTGEVVKPVTDSLFAFVLQTGPGGANDFGTIVNTLKEVDSPREVIVLVSTNMIPYCRQNLGKDGRLLVADLDDFGGMEEEEEEVYRELMRIQLDFFEKIGQVEPMFLGGLDVCHVMDFLGACQEQEPQCWSGISSRESENVPPPAIHTTAALHAATFGYKSPSVHLFHDRNVVAPTLPVSKFLFKDLIVLPEFFSTF
ncbi:Tectonic-1 [Podochytrium sp. JEL0797]|nr:Tectonic-1 [Podochytrium sp. JEL0797]